MPTTTVTECPPTPPYGFQESDGGWILETEEGVYRWYEASRTWVATDGSEAPYEDETLVPGYREECYPCPEDSSGSSSYEYRDGSYRTPDDVAEAEGEQRITTYIIITPGDREVEEIDSSATYPYDERYDFDECFPPCPEDDSWGWIFGESDLSGIELVDAQLPFVKATAVSVREQAAAAYGGWKAKDLREELNALASIQQSSGKKKGT